MRSGLLSLLLVLVVCVDAQARMLEVVLPNRGSVSEHWILVSYRGEVKFMEASVTRTSRSVYLSAFVEDLPEDALVSGIAILEDGSLLSSNFVPVDHKWRYAGIASAAQIELMKLKREVAELEQEKTELRAELKRARSELRRDAGFADLDESLQQADEFAKLATEFEQLAEKLHLPQ